MVAPRIGKNGPTAPFISAHWAEKRDMNVLHLPGDTGTLAITATISLCAFRISKRLSPQYLEKTGP